MTIENKRMVSVHYTLQDTDASGVIIEDTTGREPLRFMYGVGAMIPGFESNLEGKAKGDTFAFTLAPEEAYGEREPEAVLEIEIENFQDENGEIDSEKLFPGADITMQDVNGRQYHGIVHSIEEDHVVVDFNHPMAGRSLHFFGEVLEVSEPTEEDLQAFSQWMQGL